MNEFGIKATVEVATF